MDSVARITAWEPPRRFAAETDELGQGAPPVATEWIVEARSGGVCVVRVVHSWFASSDDWDEQFEGYEQGWPAFFRILRLYLTHFRNQSCAPFQLMGMAPEPKSEAWVALMASLGFAGAAVGQPVKTSAAAPPLAGLVEWAGPPEYPEELLLRLEEPAPGIAHLFAMAMGGQICVAIRVYLYGAQASAAVERAEPLWQTWISAHFPSVADASSVA
jgi:hypothetical protein